MSVFVFVFVVNIENADIFMPSPDYNFIKWREVGNGLGLQQLEALVKMAPTKEEEAKLSSYEGDLNELESVEKFFKEILEIPFAFLRVEAMLYRETFEDEVVQFRKSFSMLEVTINHKHISFDQNQHF